MQRKKKIGGREKMVKHVCSTSAMTRNLLKDGYVINWYYRYAHLVFESSLTAAHVCHTTNANDLRRGVSQPNTYHEEWRRGRPRETRKKSSK